MSYELSVRNEYRPPLNDLSILMARIRGSSFFSKKT